MRRLSVALLAFALATPLLHAQDLPPHGAWRTLHGTHVRVTFPAGLDALARRTLASGEHAWSQLAERLTEPPDDPIDIVVADHSDITNGFARTLPSNRIVIIAKPPLDTRDIDHFGDWIDFVVTHEMTHVFHLDRTGWIGGVLRTVFGRLPVRWFVFPASGTPRWSTEGLATVVESDYTGFGRVNGTYHDMVVRAAALADRLDPYDRVSANSPIWPGDQRVYIYGSLFLDHLAGQYGEDVGATIVDRTASALLPPFLFFDRVGSRTLGHSFSWAYDAWREAAAAHYARVAERVRAHGLTTGERITAHGRIALHARVSPAGDRIAYVADDGRSELVTRVISWTGDASAAWRRNTTNALAWLPDGESIVTSQIDFDGPYRIHQDLYLVGSNGERALTDGARLQDPDIARAGARIVAVENGAGTNRLVVVDVETGARRALTQAAPDVHWAYPRWSPDGARIAAVHFEQPGRHDIVILDAEGRIERRLTERDGIAGGPAWSPDGRYVIYSSDRTGITNLYAADLARAGATTQVTNVLGGAFFPDVSPDGSWIVYSAYTASGYHIERLPFDPASWRAPAAARPPAQPAHAQQPVTELPARPYNAWTSARPYYWEPRYTDAGQAGRFVGFGTSGSDLIRRHDWGLEWMLSPDDARWRGAARWEYAGLGNPVFELSGARTWNDIGRVFVPDSTTRAVIARTDVIALSATVLHNRWRATTRVGGGVQYERERQFLVAAPAGVRLRDPYDVLWSAFLRFARANYRVHPLSISREDGFSVSLAARVTREAEPNELPVDFEELTGFLAAYRALPLPGFAHPVLAVRTSARIRTGQGPVPVGIGGVPGTIIDVAGFDVGRPSSFLPVRGFPEFVRAGTRAWTASAEVRVPLALVGRNVPPTPLFLDRLSISGFADAGDATCSDDVVQRFLACTRLPDDRVSGPLLSAGAELVADLAIGSWVGARVRFGIAQPLRGPGSSPRLWVRFGSAF